MKLQRIIQLKKLTKNTNQNKLTKQKMYKCKDTNIIYKHIHMYSDIKYPFNSHNHIKIKKKLEYKRYEKRKKITKKKI